MKSVECEIRFVLNVKSDFCSMWNLLKVASVYQNLNIMFQIRKWGLWFSIECEIRNEGFGFQLGFWIDECEIIFQLTVLNCEIRNEGYVRN